LSRSPKAFTAELNRRAVIAGTYIARRSRPLPTFDKGLVAHHLTIDRNVPKPRHQQSVSSLCRNSARTDIRYNMEKML
jgi:hypothetical protein